MNGSKKADFTETNLIAIILVAVAILAVVIVVSGILSRS